MYLKCSVSVAFQSSTTVCDSFLIFSHRGMPVGVLTLSGRDVVT